MVHSLLPILRCPICRERFELDERTCPPEGRSAFGILRCGTHRFPVLDGIPIIQSTRVGMFEHTRGTAQVEGIAIEELTALIERRDSRAALLACLSVPHLPQSVRRLLGWRFSHASAGMRLSRALGRRGFQSTVLAARDRISALELLKFYYRPGGPLDPELGHYFGLRFGQPRHLAALALVARLPSDPKPVLDIACGMGHLEHYLTRRSDSCAVVGVDMNFYHLWIAKHWLAPEASFVCADASAALPFGDDCFSATLCSDAYHYMPRRGMLLREIERCAPRRQVILTRVGNREVMPNEGSEASLEDYLRELAPATPRVFDESGLVRCYLRRRDPLHERPPSSAELAESKWISFVWNADEEPAGAAAARLPTELMWPHGVGHLALNPIYVGTQEPDGGLRLRFEFPSIHYAYEQHAMLNYHPTLVTVSAAQLRALTADQPTPVLAPLIDSFIVLGMPRRFAAESSLPLARSAS